MKNIFKISILAVIGTLWLPSCADLEPEFSDVIPAEEYFVNEDAFISALGSAYTTLYSICNHGQLFSLQEVSSDEVCVPHRGPDWEDGGQWLRTHKHEFFDGEGVFNNVWGWAYGGISNCNRLIATFEENANEQSDAFIAELKTLRAYYYLVLVDVFGNVPLVTTFDVPEDFKPSTESRSNIYAFIETELLANVPLLSRNVDQTTYARMNYYVGQAMLAQLYLNAEEYNGSAEYAKAVAACDEIINGGGYSLESNYFNNFAVNNDGSKENIFVIPYDAVNAGGFNLVQMTLHYESQKTFSTVDQPWNGYCSLADFYNSFEEDDVRITGGGRGYGVLLNGPQFALDGSRLVDGADSYYEDTDGRDVNFNPELNELEPGAHRDGGARLSKYEYEVGTQNTMNNDFALYRYGEILLNKAEAMWRMNSGSQEALDLVNMIRERAGVAPFASLTEDNFLAERGRELCFETKRRTDLIRFGKWGDAWWAKNESSPEKKLMPIPADQIALNPNLSQNPGY
ncbi:MAG: RagB/SusD family nutrient uptake outer membrane protein [Saprospiraceae bacterium]|nr:RagB/SusD family nutrient uptake outer membrane protein [Saprospiraceae bacterium]